MFGQNVTDETISLENTDFKAMPQDNALHKAANKGDIDECKKWIENPPEGEEKIGVNDLGANDRTALHRAAGGGYVEIVDYLYKMGGDINKPDKSGRTPLHWAAIAGFVNVIKLLISYGVSIDVETASHMNILHAACEAQKVDVVRYVMEYLKDKDELRTKMCGAKNSDGKLPYELAVAAKNKEIIDVLKDLGDKNAESAACIIM